MNDDSVSTLSRLTQDNEDILYSAPAPSALRNSLGIWITFPITTVDDKKVSLRREKDKDTDLQMENHFDYFLNPDTAQQYHSWMDNSFQNTP